MKKTLSFDTKCEICGCAISAGETVLSRQDYDWDDPDLCDDELEGSFSTTIYRHADKTVCQKNIEVNRLKNKIESQHEEDIFRRAIK